MDKISEINSDEPETVIISDSEDKNSEETQKICKREFNSERRLRRKNRKRTQRPQSMKLARLLFGKIGKRKAAINRINKEKALESVKEQNVLVLSNCGHNEQENAEQKDNTNSSNRKAEKMIEAEITLFKPTKDSPTKNVAATTTIDIRDEATSKTEIETQICGSENEMRTRTQPIVDYKLVNETISEIESKYPILKGNPMWPCYARYQQTKPNSPDNLIYMITPSIANSLATSQAQNEVITITIEET